MTPLSNYPAEVREDEARKAEQKESRPKERPSSLQVGEGAATAAPKRKIVNKVSPMPRECNTAVAVAAAGSRAPVIGGIGVANVAAVQLRRNASRSDIESNIPSRLHREQNIFWCFEISLFSTNCTNL